MTFVADYWRYQHENNFNYFPEGGRWQNHFSPQADQSRRGLSHSIGKDSYQLTGKL